MKRWTHTLNQLHFTLWLALAILTLLAPTAFSQVESGQIAGTVTDPSGAVVPGAVVTVKNQNTNAERTAKTSNAGTFTVTGLTPAPYVVSFKSENFKSYSAKVEVTVGARITLDAKLTLSSNTTVVEVQAEAGVEVNTQSQEISQVVSEEQIGQLPSLSRDPYDFVAISGNISNGDAGGSGSSTGSSSNAQNSTTRGVGFNINGQRSSGTEILLDGVENVSVFGDGIGIFVPLDAVQEFRVSTSNFEPQFGRASGGVVSVTTKAGTNQFHGNTWEYNRLSAYTANTELNDQQGLPKGTYTRNQFGFTVGGPAIKDKLFFFGSGEWTRVRSAASVSAAVPTPQFLALANSNISNYFKAYAGTNSFNFVQTYSAAQVYGAGAVPTGLPATTPMFGTVSFNAPQNAGGGIPTNTYNFVARADYNMNDKTQIFFRYVDYKEVDTPGGVFASPYAQFDVGETLDNQTYLLNYSRLITSNLSANTKLSFSRFNTFQSYQTSLQNTPTLVVTANATIPGTSTYIQLPGFYDQNPANGGLPYGGPQNTVQINQDVNWLKGKHSFQFGAQLIYIQDNNAYGAYAQAEEILGSNKPNGLAALYTGSLFQFEAAVNPNGALPCVKNPYTGALSQPSVGKCGVTLPATSPSFARSERFKDWAGYGQDAWKLTPKFTLNYGVRYEMYGVQHNDNQNLDSNYYYGAGSSIPQQERNGSVFTVPNSPIHRLWNPQYGTVSPRVGFAYDLSGNSRDSIRGGYGIAYERNFGNVTFNVIQNPPNYAVIVMNNSTQNPLTVTNSNAGPLAGSSAPMIDQNKACYPAACLPPTSLRHVDQNIRTAQTQFWSLAFEHEITRSTVVSVQYVGARGIHLYDIKNYNGLGSGNVMLGDPVYDTVSQTSALTRLNNQYSNANNRGSEGDSYYHGANVQFQSTNLRNSGLGLVANYTFAHQLDDLSTTFSETNNAFSLGYTNPFNPAMDHGNGDLDVRQRLVVAPMYVEPFFKNSHNLIGESLGGWSLTGIYQVHSGTPFTYFDSTNNATGYNYARYTPVGNIPQHTFKSIPKGVTGGGANSYIIGQLPNANSWSNPNLLGISDWGPWPTNMAARNSFRGPGIWNIDASLSKTFPIHEHINAEFRAEGLNLFNHHNLFMQEGEFDEAAVGGQIIASKGGIGNNDGANDERRFGQFALKLNF